MNGLLCVLKPPGMTSHSVVQVVRRLTGERVGHTGTLDPLAAGLLVLTVGAATRLSDLLTLADKTYRAELLLGVETTTYDLEGQLTRREDAGHITPDMLEQALRELTGQVRILPPMFSAVKHAGRRLYSLARDGQQVERQPRTVQVHRFELLDFHHGAYPRALCEVHCSKGTYIRSLAQMVGERLGCGACLSFLLRTRHGEHLLSDAYTLEELGACTSQELADKLIPLAEALPELPRVAVKPAQADLLRHGGAVPADGTMQAGQKALVLSGNDAVCLAEAVQVGSEVRLQPRKVFQ